MALTRGNDQWRVSWQDASASLAWLMHIDQDQYKVAPVDLVDSKGEPVEAHVMAGSGGRVVLHSRVGVSPQETSQAMHVYVDLGQAKLANTHTPFSLVTWFMKTLERQHDMRNEMGELVATIRQVRGEVGLHPQPMAWDSCGVIAPPTTCVPVPPRVCSDTRLNWLVDHAQLAVPIR